MNKKEVERLIPTAIEAVDEILKKESNTVDKEYNGYISAFGASIIQSGLLTTVAFFQNTDAKAKQDKRKLLQAIMYVIKKENNMKDIELSLFDYVMKNKEDSTDLKEDIINAAIAVKLALRTFKLEKSTS